MDKKAQNVDIEGLVKAGFLLIIVATIFGGSVISLQLAKTFSDLGTFLVIISLIIGVIALILPFLRRYL